MEPKDVRNYGKCTVVQVRAPSLKNPNSFYVAFACIFKLHCIKFLDISTFLPPQFPHKWQRSAKPAG